MIKFVSVANYIQTGLLTDKAELTEGNGYEDIIQRIMESANRPQYAEEGSYRQNRYKFNDNCKNGKGGKSISGCNRKTLRLL